MSNNTNKITNLSIPIIEDSYSAWFDQLTDLQEGDIIHRANCKFCNHPLRGHFETKWEETRNFSMVQRLMNKWADENGGTQFNQQNVRAHLLNHYQQQERQIWKREYLDRMAAIMNYKISKDQMFEFLSNGLQTQFVEVASDPTLDLAKKSETMVKISKELCNMVELQAKLRGDIQGTQLIGEKFVKVWTHMVTSEADPTRRQDLLEHLDTFREEMGELGEIVSKP